MSPKPKVTAAQWQEMDRIARHERAGWIGCFLTCSTSTSLALTRRGWIEPNVDGSYRLSTLPEGQGMTDYQRWIRSLIKEAEKLGWTVINNGHLKFKSPEGKIVVCSNSPKCESTRFSVARDLRRAGFPI